MGGLVLLTAIYLDKGIHMTLQEAITLFRTRVDVDQDSDFDTSDNDACTDALMRAAFRVSRDTYWLYTWRSSLTLAPSGTEYDTLNPTVSTQQVFDVYGVHINGGWGTEMRGRQFIECYLNYYNAASQATFPYYTRSAPSIVKLPAPPTTVAINAIDNFIMGFRLHTNYTYSSSGVELEGPQEMHELIVDRAYLDNTKSYIASDEAYTRRAIIEKDYNDKTKSYRIFNLANFKKEQRIAGAGTTRRIYGIGGPY